MSKAIVLGASGTIGRVIVKDLVESDVDVIAADLDESKLQELKEWTDNKIETKLLNILDKKNTVELLRQGQVCINATNYIFNIEVMKAAVEAGVSVLDLGGLFTLTNEQMRLDQKLKQRNILSV